MAEGLSNPWGLAALPDGRILITEKSGSLRIVSPDGQISGAITGFPALADEGQGGLLDLSLSPDYETTRLVSFTLSERAAEGSVTALGRGRLNEAAGIVENFEILYRALPYHTSAGHFGSRVVIDEDGLIYLSTGDRQSNETRPTRRSRTMGTVDTCGSHRTGSLPRQSLHRKAGRHPGALLTGAPQCAGHGYRPAHGRGMDQRDGSARRGSLNLIRPGADYGWPAISYGLEYSGTPIGPGGTRAGGHGAARLLLGSRDRAFGHGFLSCGRHAGMAGQPVHRRIGQSAHQVAALCWKAAG